MEKSSPVTHDLLKLKKLTLLLGLFFFQLCSAFSNALAQDPQPTYRYYATAQPDWTAPDFYDDNWPRFQQALRDHPHQGIYWVIFEVDIQPSFALPDFDWTYDLHMLAAQEVFWDNKLLGTNGKPAELKQDEIPGQIWTTYLVPNQLMTPGKHLLKIKASSHHRDQGMKLIKFSEMRPFDPSFRYVSQSSLLPSLLVSIAFVVGLYFLMLYFTEGRQPEHLVFFLLLENLTLYGFAIQWDHLVGYSYDWEQLNLAVERYSSVLIWLLMPGYFLIKHKVRRGWLWLIAAAATIVLVQATLPFPQVKVPWFVSITTALSVSLMYGIKQKRLLWWESLGLVLCLIAIATRDVEEVFYYLPAFFSLILLTHAISVQRKNKALHQASLIETQLRAELLRKHIQPHFVLNTLTSLMEWVETDVDRSTEFISELAEEFRLMSTVSSKPLVPMETEISLCEKHLAIMALRLRKSCQLHISSIEGDELMPPAVFHTLLENAFSHNAYDSKQLDFFLSKQQLNDKKVRFSFVCPKAQGNTSSFRKIGTGTGKQYIEARLGQSFGRHWALKETDNNDNWQTDIEVDYKYLVVEKQETGT